MLPGCDTLGSGLMQNTELESISLQETGAATVENSM